MISNALKGLLVITILVCNSCSSTDTKKTSSSTSILSGHLTNLSDTTLTFSYDEYLFLSETENTKAKVDASGNFKIVIEHHKDLKGFFSLGRLPKTYEFEFITADGTDSSLQVSSADFRMIYIYLEPGDSLHFEVDANNLEESLRFTGSQPNNSIFINVEEFNFNDYKSKYLNNYYYKTYLQANAYKRITESLKEDKINFLKEYSEKQSLSKSLIFRYLNAYETDAISEMIGYPDGHAGFNDGKYPVLPQDYFDFLEEVKPTQNIAEHGIGQYFFLNTYLRQKYSLENPDDNELDGFYSYVKDQLPGEQAFEFLAYALGRDFIKPLYDEFGEGCPYPEMAARVKEKYSYLEGMLAGNPAPEFTLESIDGESVSLNDFIGKNIYIDFWATWCKPCVKEFPDLKRIQEKYQDQNIVFISISIDKIEDKEKWKAFVADEQLGGIQLHADQESKDKLSKALNIRSIPRFVLIDTEGKIVDADAARPSNSKLLKDLEALVI